MAKNPEYNNANVPTNEAEWNALIEATDSVIRSPSVRADMVFRKLHDNFPELSNYDLLCFAILIIPALMVEAIPFIPAFRNACSRQAYTLQLMHYVNKEYEKLGLPQQRDNDTESKG